MPVYDKPMIYYPLSTLMLAGIREVLVITTPHDADGLRRLLGDGGQFGIRIDYAAKPSPRARAGVSDRRATSSAGSARPGAGDNLFFGHGFPEPAAGPAARSWRDASSATGSPTPKRYGVVEFDDDGRASSLEEKPAQPQWPVGP